MWTQEEIEAVEATPEARKEFVRGTNAEVIEAFLTGRAAQSSSLRVEKLGVNNAVLYSYNDLLAYVGPTVFIVADELRRTTNWHRNEVRRQAEALGANIVWVSFRTLDSCLRSGWWFSDVETEPAPPRPRAPRPSELAKRKERAPARTRKFIEAGEGG